jgi:hypothetical protein
VAASTPKAQGAAAKKKKSGGGSKRKALEVLSAVSKTPAHTEDDEGNRRSSRNRLTPCAYWKNERVAYEPAGGGVFKAAGKIKPETPVEPYVHAKIPHQPTRLSICARDQVLHLTGISCCIADTLWSVVLSPRRALDSQRSASQAAECERECNQATKGVAHGWRWDGSH